MKTLLKSFYQSTKVHIPELWGNCFHAYNQEQTIDHLKNALCERFRKTPGSNDLNIMAVCPIVNWETQLLSALKENATLTHLDFGLSNVYDSVRKWSASKENNLKKLRRFFNENYNREKINVVFLYISDFHLSGDLSFLKQDNTIVVLFTWDDRLNFKSNINGQQVGIYNISQQVDFVLNMTRAPLSRYGRNKTLVLNWNSLVDLYLLHEYSPPSLSLPPRIEETVMFFGNKYGYREKVINYLVARNVPLELFGDGWGTRVIPYNDLWRKIPRVSLNLGISTIGYTNTVFCMKGRDFEVPGVGGLYLTNNSSELAAVYKPNENVLAYNNLDDCYAQCCKVLENPHLFEKIRLNGYRTANRYSWDRRVAALKSLLNIQWK